MIEYHQEKIGQAEWRDLSAGLGKANLMQDWAYGSAKAEVDGWHVERGTFSDGKEIIGMAQVLIKTIPLIGGGLAWINRGPLAREGADHYRLFESLRRHYCDLRNLYLRIAPFQSADAISKESLSAVGFQSTRSPGWSSAALDLTPDLEQLRSNLQPKWRNSLNKAERDDQRIEIDQSHAGLGRFLTQYEEFLRDRRIETSVTVELLSALQRYRSKNHKMHCYFGRRGDDALGSLLVVRTGDTVEHLASTLLSAGRKYSVGQVLTWHAICDAKQAAARWYDLGGMDPALTPKGIYDFKNGVGGKPYRLAPEIEAVSTGVRSALVRWRVGRNRIKAGQ